MTTFGSHVLHELVKVILKRRLFWPYWVTLTTVAAIRVAKSVRSSPASATPQAGAASVRRSPLTARTPSAFAATSLVAILFAAYAALSLKWQDFVLPDDSIFTLGFLKGHDLGPQIWPLQGRYFPLGYQEYNLIHHLASSFAGYQMLDILQLLVVCGLILFLDEDLSLATRACIAGFALVMPSVICAFTGPVYPDRNVAFWLVGLLYCVKKFERTEAPRWAVLAVICAQFMIYYKETAFLILLGFSVGRMLVRSITSGSGSWKFWRLRDKQSRLDAWLALLAGWFVVSYFGFTFPHAGAGGWSNAYGFSAGDVVLNYLRLDLLAWILVAVVLIRAFLIFKKKIAPSPFWEALAAGGALCFAGYFKLGLVNAYYLAAVDLIAAMYLGRLAILSWQRRSWAARVGTASLLVVVLAQNVSLSAFRIYDRKNLTQGKSAIASLIKARYEDAGKENPPRLFFPFASPYSIMEFGAYLSYRGLPVRGVPGTEHKKGLVLAGRAIPKNGPCVDYRTVLCNLATRPEAGDLVVILPDDEASSSQAAAYAGHGTSLLSFEPRPSLPQWLSPLLKQARPVSYAFERKKLPDRWLDASVTAW
jgi:hypothetical protein